MIVTGIEEQTKTKFKVYLDGTFAFVLYKGELKRFGIKKISRRKIMKRFRMRYC